MKEHGPKRPHRLRRSLTPLATVSLLSLSTAALLTTENNRLIPQHYISQEAESQMFDGNEISIVTANVHGWNSITDESSKKAFADFIRKEDPDVIFIQEDIEEDDDIKKRLHELGYTVYFSPTGLNRNSLVEGNSIAVRYQSEFVKEIDFPDSTREMQHVNMKTRDGVDIHLLNTHLATDREGKSTMQTNLIAEYIRELPSTDLVIIGGDFNQAPEEIQLTELDDVVSRARGLPIYVTFDPKGYGLGPPIDFILTSKSGMEFARFKTYEFNSDHLAVLKGFKFTSS